MSLSQALNQFAQNLGRYPSELMLRRLVPVPIKLVLILVGNDVHIASMEFLECFSYSRLLIINNRALAG